LRPLRLVSMSLAPAGPRVAYATVGISGELKGVEAVAPGADRTRVILYFHGGEHWLLSVDTYREFLGRLSARAKARVVAVAYRRPPQVRFLAGLQDALAAWRWALEQFPASAVAVAGDALGGNLAFALMARIAQLEEPQPAACIGISPWLNLGFHWTDACGQFCMEMHSGGGRRAVNADDPLACPARMGPELLRRCPPVLMHAGRGEPTSRDVRAMQAALAREGVPVEARLYTAPHAFRVGPGFWRSKATQDSLARVGAFLERHWR